MRKIIFPINIESESESEIMRGINFTLISVSTVIILRELFRYVVVGFLEAEIPPFRRGDLLRYLFQTAVRNSAPPMSVDK